MGKKQEANNEAEWRNAKKLCRLSKRQVEMAHALGMNPKKLPGLRPSAQQRWKLPVGAFIEECYRKRFGEAPVSNKSSQQEGGSRLTPEDALERSRRLTSQVEDMVCYFANLSDDLESWLVHGTIAPEVLAQVRKELLAIADAIVTGESIPQMPEIAIPPAPRSERRGRPEQTFDDDDDDIPF